MVHNTVIFSLIMMQIIALGVFGLRKSPVSSGFTFPLVIFTLLFNQYCQQRFHPVFKNHVAEVLFKVNPMCVLRLFNDIIVFSFKAWWVVCSQILIEMDREDEKYGRTEEIHQQLHAAYCQSPSTSPDTSVAGSYHHQEEESIQDPENVTPGLIHITLVRVPVSWINHLNFWFHLLLIFRKGTQPSKFELVRC